MLKRTFSVLMLTFLSASMLTLAFEIQPVKASGAIYIRADGSIDPPTTPIYTTDNITYTLTDNINGFIVIERDDIMVDGANNVLEGTGIGSEYGTFTVGVLSTGRNNVTIKNMIIEAFDYGIRLEYSVNDNLAGNKMINDQDAIFLANSSNIIVHGNNATNNFEGISLGNSSGNTISGNTITNTVELGVSLYTSSDNNISRNIITNQMNGIDLSFSPNNSISENNIMNSSQTGISLGGSSDSNVISGNSITRSYLHGMWLYLSSSNNTIFENILTDNKYGMRFDSSNNKVFHNDFIDNRFQVFSYNSINIWDDGYPSGGNYWSDYIGTDIYNGPYQNITGIDGIGDTPYVIDASNADRYPSMKPYVALVGDVNEDGKVDIKDVMLAVQAFNSFSGQPRWNPDADVDHSGRVDMRDIVLIVLNFNKRT
jgi:parallel beta-helix repeat protein